MPYTIQQGFQKLKENLEITSLQASAASDRQDHIRSLLQSDLKIQDSFLTGSYRRNTLIAPLSDADIDIFIVLDPIYYAPDGHVTILERVRRILAAHYKTSKVSRAGQAITIRFTDFVVDVVPSFSVRSDYIIADAVRRRWINTNPKTHVELWSQLNAAQNGLYIPLVKMLKAWNKCHSQYLRSFHLECIAYFIFRTEVIRDYPSAARHFFQTAPDYITTGVLDPAGLGGDISSYLNFSDRQEVVTRLQAAHGRALLATLVDNQGKTPLAFEKWRNIFGDYFPAYG